MKKVNLLSAAAVVVMLFASCEKYDQSDEIADLKQDLFDTQTYNNKRDADQQALILANTAAIDSMMARVAIAIDELGKSDAALLEAIGNGSTQLVALQAQFDEAYASALVLVNEALAGSIAQDAELAQRIEELRLLVEALQPGADGSNGLDGADGADGANGAPGMDGIDGIDGIDGVDGVDGTDGEDGSGIVEEDLAPTDGGSQTLGLNGYLQADYEALTSAGFRIYDGQSVFGFKHGPNSYTYLAPPTNGIYSWENADTDDVSGTLAEAIAAIKSY